MLSEARSAYEEAAKELQDSQFYCDVRSLIVWV